MAVTTAPARRSRKAQPPLSPPAARFENLRPQRALALPLALALGLFAFAALPSARQHAPLLWSFAGAGTALLAWDAILLAAALRRGRTLGLEVVLRKQHYLQACAQGSVLLYWGWYWPQVYDSVPLIAAQLIFAYAFDMLLTWSRRDTYTLGFGPFPVIFSINLFLWFKQDWFYLQFLMIAVGFAAKELIRWNKEGRQTHVFNPSSFPLGVFSIVLILTHSTGLTWGQEIAYTQFYPPYIFVILFLVGLPGQLFFGVTSMTMSAVVTTYVFGLLYFAATGTYFFFDSYIPIAVFLGMHLLFTDPSTSPRTELGRIMFGMLYGLGTIAAYALLGRIGAPTFYDKLLPVPILNLTIKLLDRAARSNTLKVLDPATLGRALTSRRRNLAYMSIWTAVFVVMSAAHGVGDSHPGQWLPFWQRACSEGRRYACQNLALMESTDCNDGSGWACNEFGVLVSHWGGRSAEANPSFRRSCDLGFFVGCANARIFTTSSDPPKSAPPDVKDYPIILRVGKGPLPDRTPLELDTRACDQGWMDGCERLAFLYLQADGVARDAARAAREFDTACTGGRATACSNVGFMYRSGDGVARDDARALAYLQKACDLGMTRACLVKESLGPK
jgi:hypothetical protein